LICKFLLLLQELLYIPVLILIVLYAYSDEGFIEPPSKKVKASSRKLNPATSEASAQAAAPATQLSTTSSLSKGKEIPSTAAASASPPPTEQPVSFSVFFDDRPASNSPRVYILPLTVECALWRKYNICFKGC
jgi:hypothetical protein